MDEFKIKTPAEIHVDTIRAGIAKAKTGDLQGAVSPDVLTALVGLKTVPDTLGHYLALLSELVVAHKSIRKADIEKAVKELTPEVEKDTGPRVSAADEIVALVIEACTLFTDQEDEAYAAIKQDGHREIWPINSSTFKDWVSMLLYRTAGKTPRAAALADAFSTLNGIAKHDGEQHQVYLRVATDGTGGYYLDIGDEHWRVIHITENSWQIINESPVWFRRSKSSKSIPIPQTGGALNDLKALVNVHEKDDVLLVAGLLDMMRPDTADNVTELIGEQGSGKSRTTENIRRLIDPKTVNLRGAPKTLEDIFISARNNHIVCMNNLSHLSGDAQDILCNLSTGGGYSTRKLYTNDEEVTYDTKRPVILNGINPIASRPDLISRLLRLECPTFTGNKKQLDDRELDEVFDKRAPKAMGFLLDTFTQALKILPHIELTDRPRMMDFARLGTAVDRVLNPDASKQTFTERYAEAREAASLQALESMPVIVSLIEYLETYAPYTGNYAELLKAIESKVGKTMDSAWPKSARGLSSAIGRAKPLLTFLGWDVVPATRDNRGARVTLRKKPSAVVINNPNLNHTTGTTYTGEEKNLQVSVKNPDSNSTTSTTYTGEARRVGCVDRVDDSPINSNHTYRNDQPYSDDTEPTTNSDIGADEVEL